MKLPELSKIGLLKPLSVLFFMGSLNFNVITYALDAKDPKTEKDKIKLTPWKYKRNLNEFKPTELKTIPNLPGLPPYSGKDVKPNIVLQFPNAKGGMVTDYSFETSDKPDKAYSWYRSMLSSGDWKMRINPMNVGATFPKTGVAIMCTGTKNSCTVTVNQLPTKKCQVKVSFRQGK